MRRPRVCGGAGLLRSLLPVAMPKVEVEKQRAADCGGGCVCVICVF